MRLRTEPMTLHHLPQAGDRLSVLWESHQTLIVAHPAHAPTDGGVLIASGPPAGEWPRTLHRKVAAENHVTQILTRLERLTEDEPELEPEHHHYPAPDWVVMPTEANEGMLEAANYHARNHVIGFPELYRGLLASRPEPQWCASPPDRPGIWQVRGWCAKDQNRPALVTVKPTEPGGELFCNLHDPNTDEFHKTADPVSIYSTSFHWRYVAPIPPGVLS